MFTVDNFAVQDGGRKIVIDTDGLVMVFFKSTKCPICPKFMQVYSQVASRHSRVRFACIDINTGNNAKVVGMTKNTKIRIAAVPYTVLFYNGRPFAVYKGEKTVAALNSFVERMAEKTGGGQQSHDVARGYTNQHAPIADAMPTMSGPAAPIDSSMSRPPVPTGMTKIPRNKQYLELVYDK